MQRSHVNCRGSGRAPCTSPESGRSTLPTETCLSSDYEYHIGITQVHHLDVVWHIPFLSGHWDKLTTAPAVVDSKNEPSDVEHARSRPTRHWRSELLLCDLAKTRESLSLVLRSSFLHLPLAPDNYGGFVPISLVLLCSESPPY